MYKTQIVFSKKSFVNVPVAFFGREKIAKKLENPLFMDEPNESLESLFRTRRLAIEILIIEYLFRSLRRYLFVLDSRYLINFVLLVRYTYIFTNI